MKPFCTEAVKCMNPVLLDEDRTKTFWNRYRIARATRILGTCPPDARVVVTFTTSSGAEHWIAIGRGVAAKTARGPGVAFMETEDHACHPIDRPLFQQLVELLHLREAVLQDPAYREYL